MRHRVAGYKLGRNTSQRLALRRNLITDLFRYDRIQTTEAKAKSMRGQAEHLITVAKHSLADRRQLGACPSSGGAGDHRS